MDLLTNQPWPPVVLRKVGTATNELEKPEISFTMNSRIYGIKGRTSQVYKPGARF